MIVPAEINGSPVRTIAERCFDSHREILKVELPDSIRTIGDYAFENCYNLREINFPDGLTKIGGWSLAHTSIPAVVLPDSVQKLGYGAFYGCNKLETAVLSPKVTQIDENTFQSTARLSSVTIPSAEIKIDIKAFTEGKKVTLIGIPGSYTEKYAAAMDFTFEAYEEGKTD